ncbi:MAG: TM0106 family RecB-like putative nuclease [Corynebacterium sp.]|nr:TM0106 family RecB-like putative nuclease [Corynebacterium sp.]
MCERVRASDLVGCHYRLVQRRRFPEVGPTEASISRAERTVAARAAAWGNLPVKGDSKRFPFRRFDLGPLPAADPWLRSLETLEALAAGATHITGALLCTDEWEVAVDVLVRDRDSGLYTPVIVSNHRVARRHESRRIPGVPTHRLGLSDALPLPFKPRHHAVDGYQLGLAARALAELGLDSGQGGVIGQDRETVFFFSTDNYQPALDTALQAVAPENLPCAPRRVRECASCRFWEKCEPQLRAVDEISLFLPGDRARAYREMGIDSIGKLIDANLGLSSHLARAWRDGQVLLRTGSKPLVVPRADVEIDIDMEAYLDLGAYLWGTFTATSYRPFVTWEPLGGRQEAANFAAFWQWLMARRASAHAEGKSFAAYCYSAHGENHWMRMSAKRFQGFPGIPTPEDVEAFISSDEWVDLFALVKANFVGPFGLGLKTVAPQAGFTWQDGEFAGEESVAARRIALADDDTGRAMRAKLLSYNSDDVQATACIRTWMSAGAPGIPVIGQ